VYRVASPSRETAVPIPSRFKMNLGERLVFIQMVLEGKPTRFNLKYCNDHISVE